jgi:hypothetical protein
MGFKPHRDRNGEKPLDQARIAYSIYRSAFWFGFMCSLFVTFKLKANVLALLNEMPLQFY